MNQIIFIVAKPNYIRVILYDIQNKFNNWVYKNVYLAYIISVCTLRVQMYMLILLLRNASKLEICIEVGELEPQEACEPTTERAREREPANHICEPHAAVPGHILGCPGDKVN